jgi:hypothetical protein
MKRKSNSMTVVTQPWPSIEKTEEASKQGVVRRKAKKSPDGPETGRNQEDIRRQTGRTRNKGKGKNRKIEKGIDRDQSRQ